MSRLVTLRWHWASFALYSPISVFSAPLALSGSSQAWPPLVALGVAATALSGLAGYAAYRLLSKVMARGSFLLAALISGLTRGLVIGTFAGSVGVVDPLPLVARTGNATLTTLLWLTATTAVVSRWQDFRLERNRRIREMFISRLGQSLNLDSQPDLRALKMRLRDTLALNESQDLLGMTAIAETIRQEIDLSLRPLSHRLWRSTSDVLPRHRLLPTIRDAIEASNVPYLGTLLFFLITFVPGSLWLIPHSDVLLVSVLSTSTVAAGLHILNSHLPWPWSTRLAVTALVALLAQGVPDVIFVLLGRESLWQTNLIVAVLFPMSVLLLLLVAMTLSLLDQDWEHILEVIDAGVDGIPSGQAHVAASYLHNSVQAELASTALQLQLALDGGDTFLAQRALTRLHAFVDRSLDQTYAEYMVAPVKRLGALPAAWDGIVDLQIEIDPEVDLVSPAFSMATQAVEELISNAVRHGRADRLDIALTSRGEAVTLTIVGASREPWTEGHGMGSDWLEAVTPAGWHRTSTDRGFRLEARFQV